MSNADDGRQTTPAVPLTNPNDGEHVPEHRAPVDDRGPADDGADLRDRAVAHEDRDRAVAHEDRDRAVAHDDRDRAVAHEDRDRAPLTRQEVVGRQKEEFGGFKFGSAFFGWLTAMGTAVILTAILGAIGAGLGLGITGGNANQVGKAATSNAGTVGLIGAIALAVILFVAYYCGGYVAGRMARFDGVKQGLAVWFWAVAIAIVAAIVVAIAGTQANFLQQVNAFPRIPVDEGSLTVTGIITVVVALVLSLVGAIVGGLAGMHYHRKVDRVGLERPVD
ncbi:MULTISPECIES: hypothetical protein [unclassified Curtobacterium]|uniref:hypothetical protein n=1 Tax=unclassified Curtobacterium TaxID=257496 RepID=UPI000DAA4AB1|nr:MULTISPECIES: hypothetical protein [unclassified Curtobacterium]PZE76188.1 hypothetical protein DEI82_06775 [Curtobacterium sp. MCBD17_019]WIE54418.1 hypothetical protein DEI88_015070 [Curtobacterium sp. MCBD17_003]